MADDDDGNSTNPDLSDDDHDSALGDTQSLTTTSITSRAYAYRYEFGRRYHAWQEDKYLLPNDEQESERMDMEHHLFGLMTGGLLYVCPLPSHAQSVLDIGCGTGIWAIDFADEHPSANVIGIDLSPIQPDIVPPNCSFVVDDAERDWLFNGPFDFIHSRNLHFSIRDWRRFCEQAFDHLKDGGWIECQEPMFPAECVSHPGLGDKDAAFLRWAHLLAEIGDRADVFDIYIGSKMGDYLQEAGFVDVQRKMYKWPLGSWPKDPIMKRFGIFAMENVKETLTASSLAACAKILRWSRAQLEVYLAEVRNDLNSEHEYCFNVAFWFARKPLPGEGVPSNPLVKVYEADPLERGVHQESTPTLPPSRREDPQDEVEQALSLPPASLLPERALSGSPSSTKTISR